MRDDVCAFVRALGRPPECRHRRLGLFGDFSAYYIRDVAQVRFERSDDYAFANDLVTFRALLRIGGRMPRPAMVNEIGKEVPLPSVLRSDGNVVAVRVDHAATRRTPPPNGNVCARVGCSTKLSRYNRSRHCFAHQPRRAPRLRGRRRVAAPAMEGRVKSLRQ